jgi:hypothetical protein
MTEATAGPLHAACGCEWAGAFCPHCGRSIINGAHTIRCHLAALGKPVCLHMTRDQWGFCRECGVDIIMAGARDRSRLTF